MLLHIHCTDHPERAPHLRLALLQPHLQWVKENMANIRVAGPLLNEDNGEISGSMYVMQAASVDEALTLFSEDPYHQADIWQHVSYAQFKDYAGTWVGGENWPSRR